MPERTCLKYQTLEPFSAQCKCSPRLTRMTIRLLTLLLKCEPSLPPKVAVLLPNFSRTCSTWSVCVPENWWSNYGYNLWSLNSNLALLTLIFLAHLGNTDDRWAAKVCQFMSHWCKKAAPASCSWQPTCTCMLLFFRASICRQHSSQPWRQIWMESSYFN